MRAIGWAVTNALLAATVYFGIVEGVVGARNLAVFWAWTGFAVSLFALTDAAKEVLRKKGPAVPIAINTTFDLLILAVFLWFGWFVTGAAWLLHTLMLSAAYDKDDAKPAAQA